MIVLSSAESVPLHTDCMIQSLHILHTFLFSGQGNDCRQDGCNRRSLLRGSSALYWDIYGIRMLCFSQVFSFGCLGQSPQILRTNVLVSILTSSHPAFNLFSCFSCIFCFVIFMSFFFTLSVHLCRIYLMILPVRQIHLPLIEEGVFFVGPLDKILVKSIIIALTLGPF